MSHNIHIPEEVQHVVNERSKIWSDLDTDRNRAAQLNQFQSKVGTGKMTEVAQPFTSSTNPMDELNQVMTQVNRHMGDLTKAEQEIQSTQSQMQQIKSRAQTMMIMIGGGAVAAIIAVVLFVMNAAS